MYLLNISLDLPFGNGRLVIMLNLQMNIMMLPHWFLLHIPVSFNRLFSKQMLHNGKPSVLLLVQYIPSRLGAAVWLCLLMWHVDFLAHTSPPWTYRVCLHQKVTSARTALSLRWCLEERVKIYSSAVMNIKTALILWWEISAGWIRCHCARSPRISGVVFGATFNKFPDEHWD